jgi:hypothetical protein
MVQVGEPNDVGVAQISDMLFTVADILPGCKLVSWPGPLNLTLALIES